MAELCRSCKAPIRWALSEKGRRVPLDVDPSPAGTVRLEPAAPDGATPTAVVVPAEERGEHGGQLYLAHFATCPFASKRRRPR